MAGTAAAPATGLHTNGSGPIVSGNGNGNGNSFKNPSLSPTELNNFRVGAVIDRLSNNLNTNCKIDNDFENLCLSLSRGIDFCTGNLEVANRAHQLPSLVKRVCQIKHDTSTQAAIMVLMISVKVACQSGWFSVQDSEELSNLAKQVASNFCSASDFNAEPSPSHPIISTVMSRFFPRLKMGHIFVFLEVKPGFEAYVSDFHIAKKKVTPGEKIRLLVVQTDNIETSSCLVTPAKVNFLLNGKGVERRTNLFMDTGPQVPTVVTPLLKYGPNLLQAVGEFNGNCIIIVAFMSELPNPDSNALQSWEHSPATVDADSEVIEGSSRIPLNCPISFKRINTPVKGLSCKHLQCFDFENYVDMNSRRPSWRCPHCNQHVCFSDIRIDQKMVKILKEVGPNVIDIIVSSDGSWNAAMESEETTEKAEDKTSNTERGESPQPGDVLDLTQTDDLMDVSDASGTEDRKHSLMANAINPHLVNTNDAIQRSTHIESDYWTGLYMSTFGLGSSNVRPNGQTTSPSASPSNLTEPFAVATTSAQQTGFSMPQYHQYQLGNYPVTSDYGRPSAVPRHITRTASAVQALPAQTPSPVLQRSSSVNASSSPFTPNGISIASQASPAAPNLTTSRASPHQVPPSTYISQLPQRPSIQQNLPFTFARSPQQNSGFLDPNQVPNMYREHQSSSQSTNLWTPRSTSPSPGVTHSSVPPSTSLMRPQSHAGITSTQQLNVPRTGVANTQQDLLANANIAANMSVGVSRAVRPYAWNPVAQNMPTPTGDQRVTNRATPLPQPAWNPVAQNMPTPTGDQRVTNRATPLPQPTTTAQDSADPNWRPAGRMRGALVGKDYEDAMNRYVQQPTQQAQAAQPISNPRPFLNNVQTPNSASVAPVGRPAGSGVLPDGSPEMH